MKKFIILFCICTACAGIDYTDRGLTGRTGFSDEIASAYTPAQEWWKGYNDPELNRLVDMALENNIDYAKSALAVNRALYQANLAGLNLYPTLSGSLGASTSKDLTSGDSFRRSFSGELSLSYELDLYGKVGKARDMAELDYYATALDRETQGLVLVNSIIEMYFNLAYLHGALKNTELNYENYEKLHQIAKAKYDYGFSDSAGFMQAEQSLLSAQNSITELNNQIKSAEQTLRNLLNLTPGDELIVSYVDLMMVEPLGVNLDVPFAVLAERPDLKAAEMRLERTYKNVQIQKRSWYPSISLRTSISSSSEKVGTVFDFPFFSGGLSISLPFLSWNTVKNNIRISETDYESTLLGFEQTVNTALNEVAYYYYAYTTTGSLLENAKLKHATDERLTEYHQTRYMAGKVELSELLGAINTENNSSRDVLNNIYQLIKYENTVFKALAGKWD